MEVVLKPVQAGASEGFDGLCCALLTRYFLCTRK